ncbi:MAG: hypothetical protein M3186_17570 [Actinomycetota bacterium]|nr:hypothetical protein [Actinomycetota bacterium]
MGPRVLSALGVDFDTAWSANRTAVVGLLVELGHGQLAGLLVSYYEAAWDAFLSGWRASDAHRVAFGAAVRPCSWEHPSVPRSADGVHRLQDRIQAAGDEPPAGEH